LLNHKLHSVPNVFVKLSDPNFCNFHQLIEKETSGGCYSCRPQQFVWGRLYCICWHKNTSNNCVYTEISCILLYMYIYIYIHIQLYTYTIIYTCVCVFQQCVSIKLCCVCKVLNQRDTARRHCHVSSKFLYLYSSKYIVISMHIKLYQIISNCINIDMNMVHTIVHSMHSNWT